MSKRVRELEQRVTDLEELASLRIIIMDQTLKTIAELRGELKEIRANAQLCVELLEKQRPLKKPKLEPINK